jgi:hypothetical protein
MVARVFGAALIAFALIYWWLRSESSGNALRAVLRGSAIYNIVSAVPILFGVLGGVLNTLGWIPVIIHVLLAAGFFNYGFRGST